MVGDPEREETTPAVETPAEEQKKDQPENAKASLRRVLVADPTHAGARNLLTKLENRIKP